MLNQKRMTYFCSMFIIILPKLFTGNFRGMAVYPFVFLKDKLTRDNKVVIHHESIHLRQQLEMLWFIFFLWYLTEFLIRLIVYKDSHRAYRNISFEREAYENERNFDYLKNKRFWSFTKYL